MVIYNCEYCKYNTLNITNYKRHLLTQKHINNNKFIQIENKIKHIIQKTEKIEEKTEKIEEKTKDIEKKTAFQINSAIQNQNKFNKSV
jgi:uncharacterized FlaG/YvyC family protein